MHPPHALYQIIQVKILQKSTCIGPNEIIQVKYYKCWYSYQRIPPGNKKQFFWGRSSEPKEIKNSGYSFEARSLEVDALAHVVPSDWGTVGSAPLAVDI